MKNSNKKSSLITAILAGAVTGGLIGALVTKRFQENKFSKLISNADNLANELKEKIEEQKKLLSSGVVVRENVLKEKELMRKVVDNIKQKMSKEKDS